MTQSKQPDNLSEDFTDLIKHLFLRGTSAFLMIFGRRETGKTDFSLLIAEIVYTLGIIENIATNIKIYESPFPIKHITNLDDLKFWASDTPARKLYICDEFGKAMRRRTPMSSLNVKFLDEFQILRKYKLSTIAMTPDETFVDNAALGESILDGYFLKPSFKDPKIALYYDNLEPLQKNISDIPRTSIHFDTWDVAPFKEHGERGKIVFKEQDKNTIWEWCHGKTMKELGFHPQQFNRLIRKFVKEVMERETSLSHPQSE